MLIALRIEVDTIQAARHAVPRLLECLQQQAAQASFFFALGPERAAQARGPLFAIGVQRQQRRDNQALVKPGWCWSKLRRLWPAQQQNQSAQQAMQAVQAAGHEVGLLAWDRVNWVRHCQQADVQWTQQQWQTAWAAFQHLQNSAAPLACAAPGWRSNRAAIRLQQQMAVIYASDCRGSHPFLPVIDGEPVNVPQLPTTLPTLAELIGEQGRDGQAAVAALLALTQENPAQNQVFTIHAERDCGPRLVWLSQLLQAWRAAGHSLVSLAQLYQTLEPNKLPWHVLEQRPWPAYQGVISCQGAAFPA